MRILLIDDDFHTRQRLFYRLTTDQIRLDAFGTVADAMATEAVVRYDGVIFGLPQLGEATQFFIPKLRRPVLILSADREVASKVRMLQAGADDYVTKPFFIEEVVARMRALIRRYNGHTFSVLEAGTIRLDLDSQRVTVAGEKVHLFPTEYKFLECLMLRQGRLVTRDALFDYMYGGRDEPMPKICDVMISRIRKKTAAAGDVIETVWGRGWRIAA